MTPLAKRAVRVSCAAQPVNGNSRASSLSPLAFASAFAIPPEAAKDARYAHGKDVSTD